MMQGDKYEPQYEPIIKEFSISLNTVYPLNSLVVYLKKVSLYIDEKLWTKFKEIVLRKHGTLRKLSSEVESLLRASLIDEEIGHVFKRMG